MSMLGRRSYSLTLVVLLLAGAAVLASAAMPWALAGVPLIEGSGRSTQQAWAGSLLAPLAQATGVVALAGVGGIIATRRAGRMIVGLLLFLAGASGAWASARVMTGGVVAVPGSGEPASLTWWPWVALAGCLLVALVGGLTVAIGRRWPRLGGRYEGRRNPSGASPWDAMDAGQDPTAGHDDG